MTEYTYTTPVTTAFQMQRQSIEQSQRAFEQGLEFQRTLTDAAIDSLDSQEAAQRRTVELGQTAFHSYLDAVEATVPGTDSAVEELRQAVDEQYEFLLENHAEAFENVEAELNEGTGAYDEMTDDLVAALDEQVGMLVEAHEELESQSVEAADQWGSQLEQLQDQVEEVQEEIQDVQEQAVEAVEN